MCGILGSCSLSFILSLDWALLGRGLHLLAEPMFFFLVSVGLLVIDPATSLHCVCCNYTLPFTSCYPVNSWADVPVHFFVNPLLRASHAHFLHLYLFWALLANNLAMPAHFIISFLWLSRLINFLFISFTPMGFLLNHLGLFGLITTSLPFIAFWAYWPLSQPNEFTNLFPGLFTSFLPVIIPMSVLLHSLEFLSPFTHFFNLFLFLWACWPSILPFQPARLAFLFLYCFPFLSFFILFSFFYCWAFCQK